MRLALSSVMCLAMAAASAAGQSGPPRIDVTRLGPQIGDRIPDFRLPDQKGVERTLGGLMGEKGLMLVFARSADW